MNDKSLDIIVEKLNIFDKAFDSIRLVDPVNKQVIELNGDKVENSGLQCFDIWGKNKVCDNCISIRAFRENRTFYKMEYTTNKIYMVTAIPIQLEDRRVVVELLKNATGSLILGVDGKEKFTEIHTMFDNMNNLALIDGLTGVFNRRYIEEKLPIELANTAISEKKLSIIIADIDFFKKVNDTYGHLTGDCILKAFSKLIAQNLTRDYDWVARYGGEEFLICLPSAGQTRAVEIAQDLRKKVENNIFDCGEQQIQITASFGICTIAPPVNVSVENLIEQADKKLYEAKHNGRNRVEF